MWPQEVIQHLYLLICRIRSATPILTGWLMVKRNAGWPQQQSCVDSLDAPETQWSVNDLEKLTAMNVLGSWLPETTRDSGPHLLGPRHKARPTPAPLRVARAGFWGSRPAWAPACSRGWGIGRAGQGCEPATVHSSPYSPATVAACALRKSQHQHTPVDPRHQECSSPKKASRHAVRRNRRLLSSPGRRFYSLAASKPGYGGWCRHHLG